MVCAVKSVVRAGSRRERGTESRGGEPATMAAIVTPYRDRKNRADSKEVRNENLRRKSILDREEQPRTRKER